MLETSIFLARVMGLTSIVTATLVIVQYKKAIVFEHEMAKNNSAIYISGFVFILFGILILVSHPIVEFNWKGLITLLGAVLFIKGIGRVVFPESVCRMIEKKQKNRAFIFGEIAFLIIGLYLLYHGFIVY